MRGGLGVHLRSQRNQCGDCSLCCCRVSVYTFQYHRRHQLGSEQTSTWGSPTESIDAQLIDEVPKSLNDVLYAFLTFALGTENSIFPKRNALRSNVAFCKELTHEGLHPFNTGNSLSVMSTKKGGGAITEASAGHFYT